MRYADIHMYDIANGPGIRVSLFVSGCSHKCKHCFNQVAWDYNYGKDFTRETENEIIHFLKYDYIEGLSVLGGEPLDPKNIDVVLSFLKRIKSENKKPIWLWTGYTLEEIIKANNPLQHSILEQCDVFIEGRFIEAKKDLNLKYRGSTNQRVIDVKESLRAAGLACGYSMLISECIVKLEGC